MMGMVMGNLGTGRCLLGPGAFDENLGLLRLRSIVATEVIGLIGADHTGNLKKYLGSF